MSKYFARYCDFLGSREHLNLCRHMHSLADLLAYIKQCWQCSHMEDDELLREINLLNQMPVDASVTLAGNWLPYRYLPKYRRVNWLIPSGHATEPFQDETISRYRQILLNQIIQPCTSLASVKQQCESPHDTCPSGFIFHLSRCGSTLVSGCLSELETTCVLSESPLLTELLLDATLTKAEKQFFLPRFIHLQAAVFSGRPHVIIKWNAWDIVNWQLIRELYPNVATIFLVRSPVEILASHQRSAGRHMAGDPAFAALDMGFIAPDTASGLLDNRIEVLDGLLQRMCEILPSFKVRVIDYQHLDAQVLLSVMDFFGCCSMQDIPLKIQERMRVHSKNPEQTFVSDTIKKQHYFNAEEHEIILHRLAPVYNKIIQQI